MFVKIRHEAWFRKQKAPVYDNPHDTCLEEVELLILSFVFYSL